MYGLNNESAISSVQTLKVFERFQVEGTAIDRSNNDRILVDSIALKLGHEGGYAHVHVHVYAFACIYTYRASSTVL